MRTLSLLASLAAVSLSHNAQAVEDASWLEPAYGLWSVAVSTKNSVYTDVDNKTQVVPQIFGGYGDIFVAGNRGGYSFYQHNNWFASAVINYRSHLALSQDEINDSAILSAYGIKEKKAAIEAGLHIGHHWDDGWSSRLAVLQDVSNTHKGQEVELLVYRHFQLGDISLLTNIGGQWQSDKLSNYYFSTQANSQGLVDYEAGSGWSAEVELIATYPFTLGDNSLGAYLGMRHYYYGEQAGDSPIVDDRLSQQYFAGIGWQF